jgi:glycosyltransferase involved in cell wall biosynthesis
MNLAQKSLKIVIIYDCIYPESLGGVEFRNNQLSKFLTKLGHHVTLAGWTKTNQSPLENVEILPLPWQDSLYNQEGKRTALTSLKFALATLSIPIEHFDVILTDNIPYIHLFPLYILCLIKRKPLFITWHEYWGKYWQKYIKGVSWIVYFVIEFLAAQLGKKIIAVSEFTAKRLLKNRLFSSQITIIYNGVNLTTIVESTKNLSRDGTPFIYAGRLMKEKRINLLLEAVAQLNFPQDRAILTIIGDGPEKNYLESLTVQLGISNQVKFLGRLVTIEQVWQEIAKATIAVQPSEREGFGIFPLEAMAVGTPVIYCDSSESAVGEIVRDGLEGICTAPNSKDLALTMKDLLNNHEKWSELSYNAQIRSKIYDWEHITLNLVQELVNY